jgi:RNA polymerase sigma factor for flagellar operon FliA
VTLLAMDAEADFLAHLGTIERLIGSIARRNAMASDEQEELDAWCKLKLIENDYGILRRFRGQSRFSTFLTVVLTNLFRDYRNAEWGRWRPSAQARRLGPLAVRLEVLLYRDGCTFSEAVQILQSTALAPPPWMLRQLADQLPVRTMVREVGERRLAGIAAAERADDGLRSDEDEAEHSAAEALLREALGTLDDESRVIYQLMFWEGCTVAEVARTLYIQQKRLYRRLERLNATLRKALEAKGLDAERVASLLLGGAGSW